MNQPDFDFERYPEVPGFTRYGTSQQAAEAIKPDASQLQVECLARIKSSPASADMVAASLGRSILTIRPRIAELAAKNLIRDSGARAVNRSGKSAIVWEVIP